jgi:hypothetical protein
MGFWNRWTREAVLSTVIIALFAVAVAYGISRL